MSKHRVIVEIKPAAGSHGLSLSLGSGLTFGADAMPRIAGVNFDLDYGIVPLPGRDVSQIPRSAFESQAFSLSDELERASYLVRAEVAERSLDRLSERPEVIGVFADVKIEPQAVCPNGPIGDTTAVRNRLCTSALNSQGADGSGVLVAIVDTGINLAHLNARGMTPGFDAALSWVPRAGLTPGSLPVGHGTMCAYDVCIAAPRCTLLDIALLQSDLVGPTPISGVLSDAVRAYAHLLNVIRRVRRPGEAQSLVVNNSWGMFHSSWDFPVGHPGNYSHNPNHPFNRIVGDLANEGADILFAAGNCGTECPDSRCRNVTEGGITGANSHPLVTTVAGVDINHERLGYSSIGPGRLTQNKPDISGYTHFSGSGVYAADGGTSAATPVVSGVVAAIRSKRPYESGNPSRSPAAIRNLITSTALDLDVRGYDLRTGFGVVNGCAIADRLRPLVAPPVDICKKHPMLCGRPVPNWPLRDICKRYPLLCGGIPAPVFPPIPSPGPIPRPQPLLGDLMAAIDTGSTLPEGLSNGVAAAVIDAFLQGLNASRQNESGLLGAGGCGCSTG